MSSETDIQNSEIYDSTLLSILQNEGQIAKFLDVVMGFLYRRTDFFHLMKTRDDRIGFPPGVAARMLIQSYEKHESLARDRDGVKETRTIVPARDTAQNDIKEKSTTKPSVPPSNTSIPSSNASVASQVKNKDGAKSVASAKYEEHRSQPDSSQKAFQDNPDSHNGAIRDGYSWSQTNKDCDLIIKVPDYVQKAKQVKVAIKRKSVSVGITNKEGIAESLIDSALTWDVNVEESMWSLVPKEHIHINLEKVQERWWENVFVDEPKIDTQKIEASVPMDSLGDDAKSVVDKLMYDEEQKMKGLPTSDQQKAQNLLRKAWNAEGSPFQGTDYDPSLVNISTQNT